MFRRECQDGMSHTCHMHVTHTCHIGHQEGMPRRPVLWPVLWRGKPDATVRYRMKIPDASRRGIPELAAPSGLPVEHWLSTRRPNPAQVPRPVRPGGGSRGRGLVGDQGEWIWWGNGFSGPVQHRLRAKHRGKGLVGDRGEECTPHLPQPPHLTQLPQTGPNCPNCPNCIAASSPRPGSIQATRCALPASTTPPCALAPARPRPRAPRPLLAAYPACVCALYM